MYIRSRLAAAVLLALVPTFGVAQAYPTKPIRWIIDFPAAGVSDILARTVGLRLTEHLGQAIVYDNRPGANGIIANELVAKAPGDGYTMGFISHPFSLQFTIHSKLAFAFSDFAPVVLIAEYPSLLVVHPKTPTSNAKEFIAYAKSRPAPLTYASSGAGGAQHLAMEMFRRAAGFPAVHVPYAGSQPGLLDLMAGRVEATFSNVPGALPHLRAGRLKAVAVAGPARTRMLPDVQTFAEGGFKFEALGYAGAVFPARVPKEIVAKMNAEMVRALKSPETQERIYSAGGEPRSSTPEEFGALVKKDIETWAPVIREVGATANN